MKLGVVNSNLLNKSIIPLFLFSNLDLNIEQLAHKNQDILGIL